MATATESLDIIGQFASDVARAVVAEQSRFVMDVSLIAP
jgi:hypothetical protein